MLRPQTNPVREAITLDGIWNFALASSPDIDSEQPWTNVIPPKLQVPVPSSYNDIFVDKNIRDHVGWVLYQRHVFVPRGWDTQRRFLRFDSATHHARVFVDDKLAVEHVGGYTPFAVDVTHVTRTKQFRLTVAVSNELTWDTIPPGRIETLPGGKRKQHYHHDFFNYSGLARSVWFCSVPEVFIDDITVVTDKSGTTGIIDFDIRLNEPTEGLTCLIKLFDEEGNKVSQTPNGLKGRITVDPARFWQPGAAHLYNLSAEITKDDIIVDTYNLPVGIRSIKVTERQFLINNEPFYFTGFGKHEDSPLRGKGFDPAYMIHDFNLMKWIGANSVRTTHYPYAEEFLEYADLHGIVVIGETPAVGMNLALTAGIMGQKAQPTWSPETSSEKTRESHEQAIREMVVRDKNHPSVVLWAVSNEPASSEEGAREYIEPLVSLTRSLDPSRPVCFSNMAFAGPDTDLITDLFDVVCLNRYYGWYTHTGDLDAAADFLEKDLRKWQETYKKPIIMTEYGADCQAGLHALGDVPWSEEYQMKFLDMYHRVFDKIDAVVGEHVWTFADFHCTSTIYRMDGNKKGVFTRDRRPKGAVHILKERWGNGSKKESLVLR